jgi:glycosyltransferase involved in cell wall biosynthesis
MKIAIISSGFLPVIDGVTVTLLHRLRQLSYLNHQVLLFCPDYSSLSAIYPNWQDYTGDIFSNVRVVNLASMPFMDLAFERNVSRQSYQIILQELALFEPDIIHVDEPERLWLGFLKLPGIDFAKRAKIPCVCFFHTNFIEYLEDYLILPNGIMKMIQFAMRYHRNWIYNSYDLTLVSSLSTSQKVSQLGFTNVVNANLLGVDTTQYKAELRSSNFFAKQYGIIDILQKVKLVFLGRLTPDKGWNFTLDALTTFASEINFDKLAVIIVGEGSMRAEILTKLTPLIPHLYLLGQIPPDDVPALFVNSDIHITTSEKETSGLTVMEALAAGIPVIAPRAGGIIDTIQDGRNGFLFRPQDGQDFIAKLKLLSENSALRKTMGARGKEDIAQYNWERGMKNLLKIWEEQIFLKKK